jgi:hypothetical protein
MGRMLTILVGAMAMLVGVAPVAWSGPGDGPAESGAVTRRASTAVVAFMDPAAAVGRETRPLVAFFNVRTTGQFCRMETAGDVVLQHVDTPSGRHNVLLHDDAHPVLIFDVSALGATPEEVFPRLAPAVCGGGLTPLAVGDVRVRNKVHEDGTTGSLLALFDAAGRVRGPGAEWNLSAHRRLRLSTSEGTEPALEVSARIRLADRGR